MPTRIVNIHSGARYDVLVGRPSKWGNPYAHLPSTRALYRVRTRDEAIRKYEEWLLDQPELLAAINAELKGKTLGCYCFPKPCHAEILARYADYGLPVRRQLALF